MEQELTRLALSEDPQSILAMPGAGAAELERAALEAATRWRRFAVAGATPSQARVAHVAHRGFHLLSPSGYGTGRPGRIPLAARA
ncbi:hypothetical protein [Fodinicola feengrottensis]|uniref:hypothetical protein n=1 Tax=Fodinicola feengrottensis TaxID=435914 RepID=UPI0024424CB8|nr:hypothetical protein [Fodinicola feengrottensis]